MPKNLNEEGKRVRGKGVLGFPAIKIGVSSIDADLESHYVSPKSSFNILRN
jgi:hypothetical protein